MPRSKKRKFAIDASGAVLWTAIGLGYLSLARLPLGWEVLILPVAGAATSMLFDMIRRWSTRGETRPVGQRFLGAMALAALLAVAAAMWAGLGAVWISVALFGGALVGFLLTFGAAILFGV